MIVRDVAKQLRSSDVLNCGVKAGELRRSGFSHIRNRERKKPAREGQRSSALDRVDRFGRVFLAENARRFPCAEIQFRELLDLKVEKIQRFAHETALNQFV